MKKGKSKILVTIISAILVIIAISTIILMNLFKNNSLESNISKVNDNNFLESVSIKTNTAVKDYDTNYRTSTMGEIVVGGTVRNGYCMEKGGYLYGGQSSLYENGSAYGIYGPYVDVLYDNVIIAFGPEGYNNGNGTTEYNFYRTKMKKLLDRYNAEDSSRNWQVPAYGSEYIIYEDQQYAFWTFTKNTETPTGNPYRAIYQALVGEAKNIVDNDMYGQKDLKGKTNVSVSYENANIAVSGVGDNATWRIGPFNLVNPNHEFFKLTMENISFKENNESSTITEFNIVDENGKDVNGYSDYYGWSGNFYVTFNHSFKKNVNYNVKLNKLNSLSYSTTATRWTNSNTQPVTTLTRKPNEKNAPFDLPYTEIEEGDYHLNLSKRSTTDEIDTIGDLQTYTNCLAGAKFNITQYVEESTEVTSEMKDFESEQGKFKLIDGIGNKGVVKISSNYQKYDKYIIEETSAPTNYNLPTVKKFELRVFKKSNGGKYELDKVEAYKEDGTKIGEATYGSDSPNYFINKENNIAIDMSNNAITVTILDTEKEGEYILEVEKIDAKTKIGVPGITFTSQLEGKNSNTVNTGDNGKAILDSQKITKDNLTPDHYIITENLSSKYVTLAGQLDLYVNKSEGENNFYASGISDTNENFRDSITYNVKDTKGNNIVCTATLGNGIISLVIENEPNIPPILKLNKVDSENNNEFLLDTDMTVKRKIKDKDGNQIGETKELFSGKLKDINPDLLENDKTAVYTEPEYHAYPEKYVYEIYENEAAEGYVNILKGKMYIEVTVWCTPNINVSTTVLAIEGEEVSDEEIKIARRYVSHQVDHQNRIITGTVENPKENVPVRLQLFKHQLGNKEEAVKNAEYTVKEIDANGNKISDLPGFTTNENIKDMVSITEGKVGKSYYYEIIEENPPTNYINQIKGVRVKLDINKEGQVSSSITQIMKKDSTNWEAYDTTLAEHASISEPDDNNNVILYMANSVKYKFDLYKRNYATITDLEEAEEFNGTAQFNIEKIIHAGNTVNESKFSGTLNDAHTFFEEDQIKANATYRYKVTETYVSDEFYNTLVNKPIIVTIRTDENGKVKEEGYGGSNWEFDSSLGLTDKEKENMSKLIKLVLRPNNQINLYIGNMPKNHYSLQLVKVDKKGNTITTREATFNVGMETNNPDGEGIEPYEDDTTKGILDIVSKHEIDPGFTHTYTIKETHEPLGFVKLPGTITVNAEFTEDGKLLDENISLEYKNEEDVTETIEGLKVEPMENAPIPIIQVFIPNDSKLMEFELIKEDLEGNKVVAEELSNGNIDGAHFVVDRVTVAQIPGTTTNVTETEKEFFKGRVINDVLKDGTVNDVVPAFSNLIYIYQIDEIKSKSSHVNILDGFVMNLKITTDDEAKIVNVDYEMLDTKNSANNSIIGKDGVNEPTTRFRRMYGEFITIEKNDTGDKVNIHIKNSFGYKVRLNKINTSGKPIKANIEAYLNVDNYNLSYDKRKCAINGTYQIDGTNQTYTITDETTHLSEEFIIPKQNQTWTIVERAVDSPYYNVFENKYIDVEVEMTEAFKLVVKGYKIIDSTTKEEVRGEELEKLNKYIDKIEFIKENDINVLNVTLKNPTKYRFKLTKYESDNKTELKGATINVNGKDVIGGTDGEESFYTVDNIADLGEKFEFRIRETKASANHINIFEEDSRYLIVGVKLIENDEIEILYSTVFEHANGNPKPWVVRDYDEIYNYIDVTKGKDEDGVPVVNVGILNPIDYIFEVDKKDTAKNPLSDAYFQIISPVVKAQSGKYIEYSKKVGVNDINTTGTINGITNNEGIISYEEKCVKIGEEYEYKIVETGLKSQAITPIPSKYNIYVKVTVNKDGSISLGTYENNKNYIVKDNQGNIVTNYDELITATIDNTGKKPVVKVDVENPVRYNIILNKKLFGEEGANLSGRKFKITNETTGRTETLTSDVNGLLGIKESEIKAGTYKYIITEETTNDDNAIINTLEGKAIVLNVKVEANGSISIIKDNESDTTNGLYVYNYKNNKLGEKIPLSDKIYEFVSVKEPYYGISTNKYIDKGVATIDLTVINPEEYGIMIYKKDKDTDEEMNGIEFKVSVYDSKGKEVKLKDSETFNVKNLDKLTTAKVDEHDGVIKIDNILFEKTGLYTIKLHEINVQEGYKQAEDIELQVSIIIANGRYTINNLRVKSGEYFVDKNKTKIVNDDKKSVIFVTINNEKVKGAYTINLNKTDLRGNSLDGAKFKVTVLRDNKESVLYKKTDDVTSKEQIIPGEFEVVKGKIIPNIRIDKVESYILRFTETEAPKTYVKLENPIDVKVTTKRIGKGMNEAYVLESAEIVSGNEKDLISINSDESAIRIGVRDEQFDLSLRKYITQIEHEGQKTEITNREPQVDVTPLKEGTDTTAIYNHTKDPISLYAKDTVIYKIRIYNEADIDGYAEEVTDHLPEYLEFVNDEFNSKYGWILDESDKSLRTVRTNYLSKARDEKGNLIKAFNNKTGELDYKELEIKCRVKENTPANLKLTNIAEISKYIGKGGRKVVDRDSEVGNVVLPEDSNLPSYRDDEISSGIEYIPGQQDDDDFEKVLIEEFDLALRKFITGVTNGHGDKEEVTTRIPVFKVDENGKYVYEHTKEPVLVANQNIVEYTIRVYNEGTVNGYAKEIKDDIPEGLEFLPDDELNKEYRWIMLDEEGKETDEVNKAKYIVTDYLSKENEKTVGDNLLKAFDKSSYDAGSIKEPDYKEVKVAFKVTVPNTSDEIIINQAQISDDSDEYGNEVTDKDSTPNEWIDGEDDQDIEKIKVQYFDLALRKWVTKAIVIEDGKETVRETGHKAEDDPEAVVKVDLKKSKLNKVVVKFEYQIRVTNEGQIAGSVEEISDYIPEGLKFVSADNPEWEEVEGKVVTDQLAGQIMQPGESKEVTILLTWINSENNMGLKVNIAEISKDYNEYGSPDIDSTPNNKEPGEDDIDDAPVMLTITTGEAVMYVGLGMAILTILAGGIIGIKKYVIK